MTTAQIKETDLYHPIHEYLVAQGYTVRSEVEHCDITAIKDEELIIIELKKSFNLELLIQATQRQRAADSVYVAVPRPKRGVLGKRWNGIHHLLRRLELGLILVSFTGRITRVEVAIDPVPFDRAKSMQRGRKQRNSIIREAQARQGEYNVGGSKGKKLMTAYRENALQIAVYLSQQDRMAPRELKALGTGKKTPAILQDNHYGWFERVTRGIYTLTSGGQEALREYPELVEHYLDEYAEKTLS